MSKVTKTLLKKIFPRTPDAKLERFVAPFNTILPRYGITTKLRFAAFIANVGIESDRLKAMEEYASGAAYEGREGLGNVRKGDGVRYKGRDIMQTTGRYNYWKVVVAYLRVLTGKNWDSKLANSNFDKYVASEEYDKLLKEADKYNVNFLANPELLEVFPHAVEAACVYVKDNNLNDYADRGRDGFKGYAGILNTGSPRKKAMHYDLRLELYDKAMSVIPDSFSLTGEADKTVDTERSEDPMESNGDGGSVKVEVDGNNVSVETNTPNPPPPKEKVAVVAPAPIKWYSGLGTKIVAAVTGNAGVIWVTEKLQEFVGLVSNPAFWYVVVGIAAVGTAFWLWNAAKENREKKAVDAELIKLHVEQNSTPNNYVQTIPHNQVELYRARGYKIISVGESVPQPSA